MVSFLLLLVVSSHTQTDAEVDAAIAKVRTYLAKSASRSSTSTVVDALQNSNKIGLGYNPASGTPVCYTSDCQMEGFACPIFTLNYSEQATGSCTTKLIREYVNIDCQPSIAISSTTEIINTMEKLFQSTTKGLDVSL